MTTTEFWLMLSMTLFVYFVYYGIYWYSKKFPPKGIGFYGYRTPRSMKNEENWKFANTFYLTLIPLLSNGFLIILVGILLLFYKKMTTQNFGFIFTLLSLLKAGLLLGITEYKLWKFEQSQQQ